MKIKINKIKVNISVIKKLTQAQGKAMELTADAVLSDIVARAVVPKDTGDLERSGFVKKVNNFIFYIIYSTPYARRWYFNADGATFQTTKNPSAQDHWMDYYKDGEGLKWLLDTYANFFKQESGDIIR